MTELPKGWALAILGEVADVVAGQSPAGSEVNESGEGLPFFQGKAEFGDLYPEVRKWTTNAARTAKPDDVLLSVRAPVGPTNLAQADCAIGRGLMAIRQHPSFADRYLLWVLRASSEQLRSFATGSTFEAVTGPVVRQLQISVAPTAEQERIVTAIEEAFSKLHAGEAGLRTVRQLLKRMREAILTAAVTGRLVPQDPTDTPAAKLLADLGAESIAEPESEVLPDGWAWALLGSVSAIGGGIQKQPKRNPVRNRAPFLRVANVGRGKLDLSDVHEIEVFDGELDRYGLVAGDLLVVEGNGSPDQIGRSALWHGKIAPCVHQNHLIRVRPGPALEPSYLELYWNSPAAARRVQSVASSTSGLHTLSTGKLKILPVVVPPLEEQKRIVTEVERQFSFVDACERAVDEGLARSAALRRSVLKAAFEGRLVPQDPSDEPASVLLDRIRAERAAQPVAKRRARQTA